MNFYDQNKSHRHLHRDFAAVFVVYKLEVFEFEFFYIHDVWIELQLGERQWNSLQLFFQRLHVVGVDVGIAQNVDKLSALQIAHLCKQACQQRVTRNVEGHAEAKVTGSLVHLTRKSSVDHVELGKDVARRQSHLF